MSQPDVVKTLQDGKSWSAQAEEYKSFMKGHGGAVSNNPMQNPLEKLILTLNDAKPLSTATAILDNGCGTGNGIARLFELYGSSIPSDARLIASDFSEGMMTVFRQTIKEKVDEGDALYKRLETEIWDTQDLSALPDNSLSHILSSFVLMMVPDPPKAFRELHRVLAPSGVFAQTSWAFVPWLDFLQETRLIMRPDEKTESVGFKFPPSFQSLDGVRKFYEDAGFVDVQVEWADGVMASNDIDQFTHLFSRSKNPGLAAFFRGLDEKELEEMEKLMNKRLKEMFPDGKIEMVGKAVVSVGRKK